ncbi:hypothetical protein TI39_contig4215g00011 [Zymoseptoria brevis]|uniref:Rhodanese domain-containing protein n=1 Tax=Zymoseptoria brevis TaxID=1047168 RepID=A0A0F4GD62_9PEZI|nr:hypothetical protein TI39_contig4215g00011 [Zymoseptoria brevis]
MAVPIEQPWHAAFSPPTLVAPLMPRNRVHQILSLKIGNLLIIDTRRTDYLGGSIRGSLNIPAQGFWWNRGALYELAYKADIEWVVFTCGSSNGRGPRCAGWFLDHVRKTAGDENMQVCVLEGGVKGWVKAGEEYTGLMDGFDGEYWKELFEEEEKKKQGIEAVKPELANAVGQGDVSK